MISSLGTEAAAAESGDLPFLGWRDHTLGLMTTLGSHRVANNPHPMYVSLLTNVLNALFSCAILLFGWGIVEQLWGRCWPVWWASSFWAKGPVTFAPWLGVGSGFELSTFQLLGERLMMQLEMW